MAELLKGKAVAEAIARRNIDDVAILKEKGVIPALALFRVGEKDEDLSYERGIDKRSAMVGIEVKKFLFPEDVEEETLYHALKEASEDPAIHGILVMRPLPKRFDDRKLRDHIDPAKDVDGCTELSLAGVFTGTDTGFAPCTAKAAMEILDYYGIDPSGKRAVVLGRSLVIGRPVAMLLMHRNATVTICHT
ncbi:MAG: bifunctional 5,10-methylene-tetrahydrofolate dehydrogenase/5,10-methylene-tetrahydrofolate cyclohydrolase, partial [Erysipelotrichaceae bacterium]|nr:bifunctional 5,10-methylene-tetrahydrofolate dehydrogenase/5,10-methylene-tetrahydrofolate cyclohydrolase [Erysipelotrichaceae bacterium]